MTTNLNKKINSIIVVSLFFCFSSIFSKGVFAGECTDCADVCLSTLPGQCTTTFGYGCESIYYTCYGSCTTSSGITGHKCTKWRCAHTCIGTCSTPYGGNFCGGGRALDTS